MFLTSFIPWSKTGRKITGKPRLFWTTYRLVQNWTQYQVKKKLYQFRQVQIFPQFCTIVQNWTKITWKTLFWTIFRLIQNWIQISPKPYAKSREKHYFFWTIFRLAQKWIQISKKKIDANSCEKHYYTGPKLEANSPSFGPYSPKLWCKIMWKHDFFDPL